MIRRILIFSILTLSGMQAQPCTSGSCAGRYIFAGISTSRPFVYLENPGYAVWYDPDTGCPAHVAFRSPDSPFSSAGPYKREKRFRSDVRVTPSVHSDWYKHSGYTRGHLAPSAVIWRWYGPEGMKATYLMTNICPQKAAMNSGIWSRIEAAERDFIPGPEETWFVLTGPVHLSSDRLISRDKVYPVLIPDGFYRIRLDVSREKISVIGWLIPQETESGSREMELNYRVTVDTIEAVTGTDFFPELADDTEDVLESSF